MDVSPEIQVLHVDDDESFGALAASYLESEGIEVSTADSPNAALDALDDAVDCVVSDYDMDERNGLDLLEAIRDRYPDLPFVLFTGKGSEEIASEAISAGVTDYLQKETSPEQFTLLANRIERAVTERRTQQALEESERMLSTLVSNLPGVVYRCRNEPDWPMTYMDGNVEELTGYESDEFVDGDREWGDLIQRPENEDVWDAVQSALDEREPFEITYRIRTADGETRWVWEQGRGVFEGADGEPSALEGFIADVTERKRRERELMEYERLVDAMGDPVYTTDAEGYFTTFNERAAEMVGYEQSEVVGEPVSTLLDESDIERGRAVIRELLGEDEETTAAFDISIETADGEVLELENHVALLVEDGEFRGTIGVLRSSEEQTDSRLRRLHDATRELMAESDVDRIGEMTTQAAAEKLGIDVAAVWTTDGDSLEPVAATETATETFDEHGRLPIEGTVAGDALADAEPKFSRDLEDAGPLLDHTEVGSCVFFPLGDFGVFLAAALAPDTFDESDIQLATILAANAEAAIDRARKEAELRQERDDFAALFENVPDPAVEAVIIDGEPRVNNVNPAFEEVFGYSKETVVGENLDEYIIPEDRENEVGRINERISSGEEFQREVRRQTADGIRDFIFHVVPREVGEESTRGYGIYTDITEQKQRERELERQNERLDQFASVVSHDLRNPLSVAEGRLELARLTGEDEHFDAVERAHERMDELISGLLALARQGYLAGEPISVELENAARSAWETTETGELALEYEDATAVTADPERLRQLLENLFGNAAEHADGATTVTVGGLDDGFYVADDGDGIAEDEREAVFESGYSSVGGTGFGLAIVETIAEAHGWSVEVRESDVGGARFEFRPEKAVGD